MTNPKIEKVKSDIVRTKTAIAEYQKKLRDLERQKTELENLEIIAIYRKENFSEDEFAELLRSQRKSKERQNEVLRDEKPETASTQEAYEGEKTDANIEN